MTSKPPPPSAPDARGLPLNPSLDKSKPAISALHDDRGGRTVKFCVRTIYIPPHDPEWPASPAPSAPGCVALGQRPAPQGRLPRANIPLGDRGGRVQCRRRNSLGDALCKNRRSPLAYDHPESRGGI